MVIERMICLSNGSTAQPVVMRQNDYNTAEIRLLVYETPNHLLDMTGMAAVVSYEVDGVPTDPYEAKVEESHWLRFVVPGEVTEKHGNGRMQIGIYLENSLTHSYMLPYEVEYSLPMPGPGTKADPAPAFFSLVKEARETMANVKDGGYYSPNVDETGNLSWVGSDSDMPVLPTVNIMGPKGNDGQKGDAGSTPIINASGNWEISGVDTGVKADWSKEQTNAATSAAAAAKSAENAAESADDAAESAEEAAASLGELNAKKEAAIDEIQAAGDRTLDSIPQDYTSLVTDVARMANAIVIDDLDPANIVHVTNAAARPAVELVTYIEPVQAGSGDPSLDNVRAISGLDNVEATRTGKNIITAIHAPQLPCTIDGVTFSDAGNGRIAVNGTAASGAMYTLNDITPGQRTFIPAGTYTLSGLVSGTGAKIAFAAFLQQTGSSFVSVTASDTAKTRTITLDQDAYYGVYIAVSKGATSNAIVSPQLELGTVATDYKPYEAQTLTADLPETVYGGNNNWTIGMLTVEKGKHILDGVNGVVSKVSVNASGVYYASAGLPTPGVKTGTSHGSLLSDKLIAQSKVEPGYCYITGSNADVLVVSLPNQSLTTADAVNAWLMANPITFVYNLAEPYTIQLTPQKLNLLKGITNVWSNCGKTKLVYIADTKKYIDEKIAALAAAQLGV